MGTFEESLEHEIRSSISSTPPVLQSALQFIHENLHGDLSLVALTKACGISRWQLQRHFAKISNLGLAEYIRRLRLGRAAYQLVHSSERQMDIAVQCGFDSEVSFSRSFRQHFGCSPRDYRKRACLDKLLLPLDWRLPCHIQVEQIESIRECLISRVAPIDGDIIELLLALLIKYSAITSSPLTDPAKTEDRFHGACLMIEVPADPQQALLCLKGLLKTAFITHRIELASEITLFKKESNSNQGHQDKTIQICLPIKHFSM